MTQISNFEGLDGLQQQGFEYRDLITSKIAGHNGQWFPDFAGSCSYLEIDTSSA